MTYGEIFALVVGIMTISACVGFSFRVGWAVALWMLK